MYSNVKHSIELTFIITQVYKINLFKINFCYCKTNTFDNAEQVIAGRIRAQTGSSYIGMATNDMHTLTSLLLLNQLQHHTL